MWQPPMPWLIFVRSPCNVLYKLISKVLANQLKWVLPKCILEEQSGFVEGCCIIDNAIMAIEILHYMKNKRAGKHGDMALKIDISKGYDSVNWGFIKATMLTIGFAPQWVQWICYASLPWVTWFLSTPTGWGLFFRGGDSSMEILFLLTSSSLFQRVSLPLSIQPRIEKTYMGWSFAGEHPY